MASRRKTRFRRRRTYRRKTRPTRTRRFNRRSKRGRFKGVGRPAPANRTFRTVRWTERNTNISAVVGLDLPTVRLQGAYDPRFQSGGQTPEGWTYLSTMYNHYLVHSTKVTYSLMPLNNDSAYIRPARFIWRIDDDGTYNWLTSDDVKLTYDPRNHIRTFFATWANTTKPMVFSVKWSAKKQWGSKFRDPEHYCKMNELPKEDMYLMSHISSIGNAFNIPVMSIEVRVEYNVEFFEPKDYVPQLEHAVRESVDIEPNHEGVDPVAVNPAWYETVSYT